MAPTAERRFPVMGTTAHVVVVGRDEGTGAAVDLDALAERAAGRLALLEARWSRFRPTSELSALNAAHGRPCRVSGDTVVLVDALRAAWELTGGRFDPTVHDGMVELGYGTSFTAIEPPLRLPAPHPAPGCAGVVADPAGPDGLVVLPDGVHLDPGGLGKGLAADLVAGELLAAGAAGALVNVGGDVRVAGTGPTGGGWLLDIEDPDDPHRVLGVVDLADGGIATSTTRRRRWTLGDGREVHHLLDPATGAPAAGPRWQVTVVAGSGWWAEVAAKVALLDGELAGGATAALLVDETGTITTLGADADTFFRLATPAGTTP